MNTDVKTFNPEDMYHMFDLKLLENNIWYFKNVISYPDELVQFINEVDGIQESYSVIDKWTDWTASDDKNFVYGKNKNIMPMNLNLNNRSNRLGQKMLYIKNSFEMAFEMCLDRYLAGHGLDKNNYNLNLTQIPVREWVGPGMGPHCDNYDGDADLEFSMICYLNDSYEGGEIKFPNHNITLKPAAGSLVIFPSKEPYVHQVNDISAGKRYTSHVSVYKR